MDLHLICEAKLWLHTTRRIRNFLLHILSFLFKLKFSNKKVFCFLLIYHLAGFHQKLCFVSDVYSCNNKNHQKFIFSYKVFSRVIAFMRKVKSTFVHQKLKKFSLHGEKIKFMWWVLRTLSFVRQWKSFDWMKH